MQWILFLHRNGHPAYLDLPLDGVNLDSPHAIRIMAEISKQAAELADNVLFSQAATAHIDAAEQARRHEADVAARAQRVAASMEQRLPGGAANPANAAALHALRNMARAALAGAAVGDDVAGVRDGASASDSVLLSDNRPEEIKSANVLQAVLRLSECVSNFQSIFPASEAIASGQPYPGHTLRREFAGIGTDPDIEQGELLPPPERDPDEEHALHLQRLSAAFTSDRDPDMEHGEHLHDEYADADAEYAERLEAIAHMRAAELTECDPDVAQGEALAGAQTPSLTEVIARITRMCKRQDSTAMNEYSSEWFYFCFPTLFPYGVHPTEYKSVHMVKLCLLHFSGVYSIHPYFTLFAANRYQRQQVAAAAGRFVSFKRGYALQIITKLSSADYRQRIRLAIKDPRGPGVRVLWQELERFLTLSGSSVSWSPLQRRASISELLAYNTYFGLPSYFITVAFDDGNQSLTLSLHKAMQRHGLQLPHPVPDGDPLAEVTLTMAHIRAHRNDNATSLPSIAAASFICLFKVLVDCLIACPRTREFSSANSIKGVFGHIVAWWAAFEQQQRGVLHVHMLVWGGLRPDLVSRCMDNVALRAALTEALDSAVCSQIPQKARDNVENVYNLPHNKFLNGETTYPFLSEFSVASDCVPPPPQAPPPAPDTAFTDVRPAQSDHDVVPPQAAAAAVPGSFLPVLVDPSMWRWKPVREPGPWLGFDGENYVPRFGDNPLQADWLNNDHLLFEWCRARAAMTQIHRHTFTCWKNKACPWCRLGFGKRCLAETQPVELLRSLRQIYERENRLLQQARDGRGRRRNATLSRLERTVRLQVDDLTFAQTEDPRGVKWVWPADMTLAEFDAERRSRFAFFLNVQKRRAILCKIVGDMGSLDNFGRPVDPRCLVIETARSAIDAMVATYSPAISSFCASNNACYHLGSASSVRSVMMYLANYLTKEGVKPQLTLPVIRDMMHKALSRKSTREDRDTVNRHLAFVMQLLHNGVNTKAELSSPAASTMCLGFGTRMCSIDCVWFWPYNLVNFAREVWGLPPYMASGDTGAPGRDGVEVDELLDGDRSSRSSSAVPEQPASSSDADAEEPLSHSASRRDRVSPPAALSAVDRFPPELGRPTVADTRLPAFDASRGTRMRPGQHFAAGTVGGEAPQSMAVDTAGTAHFIDASLAYYHRPLLFFKDTSYYVFSAICKFDNRVASEDLIPTDAIRFEPAFPAYKTQYITLRRVFVIPRWAGKVLRPVWRATSTSQRALDEFAEVIGAIFFPWDPSSPRGPQHRTWASLAAWMGGVADAAARVDINDEVAARQSRADVTVFEWIRSLGSFEAVAEMKSLNNAHRGKYADPRFGGAPRERRAELNALFGAEPDANLRTAFENEVLAAGAVDVRTAMAAMGEMQNVMLVSQDAVVVRLMRRLGIALPDPDATPRVADVGGVFGGSAAAAGPRRDEILERQQLLAVGSDGISARSIHTSFTQAVAQQEERDDRHNPRDSLDALSGNFFPSFDNKQAWQNDINRIDIESRKLIANNTEQLDLYDLVTSILDKQHRRDVVPFCSSAEVEDFQPFRIFIDGAPGTGKTFLSRLLIDAARRRGLKPIVVAPTGAAANHHDTGATLHSVFKFVRSVPREWKSQEERMRFAESFDSCGFLLIDEISMVSAFQLGTMIKRLAESRGNGRIPNIIVVGDMRQVDPPGGGPLYVAPDPAGAVAPSVDNVGRTFFAECAHHKLRDQMRAHHDEQRDLISDLRKVNPARGRRVTDVTSRLRMLGDDADPACAADATRFGIQRDGSYAPVITPRNCRRCRFNYVMALEYGLKTDSPIVIFYKPQDSHGGVYMQETYAAHPHMVGIFVFGAPGVLTSNIATRHKASNGTEVVLHSLSWDDETVTQRYSEAIANTPPGEVIIVPAPSCIHVEFRTDVNMTSVFGASLTLRSPTPADPTYSFLLPVPLLSCDKLPGNTPPHFAHGVDIAFAVTFHKVQGSTSVDLCFESQREAKMQMIYVALSRFGSLDDVRLLSDEHDCEFLRYARWNPNLLAYLEQGKTGGNIITLRQKYFGYQGRF